jgi:protein O-mannosyl-transferase
VNEKGNPAPPAERLKNAERAPGKGFRFWALALGPVLLTFLFYLPVLQNGFMNWDDQQIITENFHIRSLSFSNLSWMFTDTRTGNWMPLTWLSFALDYLWGGLNPLAFHLDNLLLHCLDTLLVFFLGLRLLNLAARDPDPSKRPIQRWLVVPAASLTALLFGLHPLHVESVAWATERKDVLYGLFFLLSLLAYLDYASSGGKKTSRYFAALGFFLLSVMAKPMAVTLPVVLLLLDAWPLGRFSTNRARSILEKVPFLLLSLLWGLRTVAAQAGGMPSLQRFGFPFRLMNALHSVVFYIVRLVAPVHLTAFYPLPSQEQVFSLEYLLAGLLVVILSFVCFHFRQKRPYLGVVWLFYWATLAPVLGVLQAGEQAAADRYAYLPTLGFLLLFSSGAVVLFSGRRWMGALGAAALTLALGYATVQQVGTWRTPVTLWENVVRNIPGANAIAYSNLVDAYRLAGRLDEALKTCDEAIASKPSSSILHEGKGIVLVDQGKLKDAIPEFKTAIESNPHAASPHRNLWGVYNFLEMRNEELGEAQEAVRLDPDYVDAYNLLAISYGYLGDYEKSIEAFQKALSFEPGNPKFLMNLATAYQRMGKYQEAIDLYQKAIALDPYQPAFYFSLGGTYLLKGMNWEAIGALVKARDLQPQNLAIDEMLAKAYEKTGQKEKAAETRAKVKDLKPKGS